VNADPRDRVDPAAASASAPRDQRTRQGAVRSLASGSWRHAKRVITLVVGLTVVAIGTAMIVLPGPAFVVIPVGLGILATEFVWAQRLLHNLKQRAKDLVTRNGSAPRE
jgi:tellurite resistance protein TerC